MHYIKRLLEKRDLLMNKYALLFQKPNLTEDEMKEKNKINQEIIHLDFEIENVKREKNIS
ncbi:hypothetical protein [Inediibacterium massiliense]|uniref:hypothetical protein n=1 Tax=Inediibacterium massiliense TaxID=1658111 RepID=UPI0006B69B16|nr:hypothetical protein [Inediibacterium massiliense]